MAAGLLLDGLLLLVVALYVPIGAWRGGVREAVLGGAFLLGAANASLWATSWGDALSDATGLSESAGRFLAAVLTFGVVGLGLGFAGGVVAGRRGPDPIGRLVGGVFGLGNILFALATVLSFVPIFLADRQPAQTVDESWLADQLVERRGWLLLLAIPVYGCVVVAFRWAVRFDDEILEQPAAALPNGAARPRRARSVGVPVDPDSGKVDPGSRGPSRVARTSGAFGGVVRSTREIVPPLLVTQDVAGPLGGFDGSGSPIGGRPDRAKTESAFPPVSTVVDDWLRRAADQGSPRSSADSGGSSVSFTGAALSSLLDPGASRKRRTEPPGDRPIQVEPAVRGTNTSGWRSGQPDPAAAQQPSLPPIRRCQVCGTPAVSDLSRCPFCAAEL